jgi:hypothetical protein
VNRQCAVPTPSNKQLEQLRPAARSCLLNCGVRRNQRRMRSVYVIAHVALALVLCPVGTTTAETISACGQVERYDHCLLFWRFDQPTTYLLPDSMALSEQVCHITGETYSGPAECGYDFTPHLRNVVVAPCEPETLGCGVLGHYTSDDGDCYCWRHLPEQSVFNVQGLGGFAVGDTVLAAGIPCPACLAVGNTCEAFGVSLFDARFTACPDSLNSTVPESWGRIKARYSR